MIDAPSWIQAGVVVISLCFGAVGSYYSINSDVVVLQQQVKELPVAVDKLTDAVNNLNITVAVLNEKTNKLENEKGH